MRLFSLFGRKARVLRYSVIGALIGGALGVGEAMASAAGERRYWDIVWLHFLQLGCSGLPIGLLVGRAVAHRVDAREDRLWHSRRARRECVQCGYDLRGTAGDVCPECGAVNPRVRRTDDGKA